MNPSNVRTASRASGGRRSKSAVTRGVTSVGDAFPSRSAGATRNALATATSVET